MDNKTLTKIQKFLNALDDESLTKEDFVKSFEKVVELIQKMQVKNENEIKSMWDLCQKLKEKMGEDTEMMKDKTMSYCVSEMKKMSDMMSKKMAELKDGEDGEDADEEEIVKSVLERIEMPVIPEKDTPEQIRDSLETLKDNERLDVSAIKGLEDKIKKLEETVSRTGGGRVLAGPNANAVQSADISTQFNGVLTTFTVPRHRRALMFITSQSPFILRPVVDFTTANTVLTINSAVGPIQESQTGIFLFVK